MAFLIPNSEVAMRTDVALGFSPDATSEFGLKRIWPRLSRPVSMERALAIFSAPIGRRNAFVPLARRRAFFGTFVFIFFFVFLSPELGRSQGPAAEYKLKAVYLFNFVQYVEWPKEAFATEKSPLIIGVLGNDPFGKVLDDTVRGESVKGRPLELRRYKSTGEIQECHVLFVSASEAEKKKSILAALKGRGILTVSDMPDFASSGGVIRFVMNGNKIGFRINTEAAKTAGLSISSKLLQLAEVVSTEKR